MGWFFTLFYNDCLDELGASLISSIRLFLYLIIFFTTVHLYGDVEKPVVGKTKISKVEYYKYWNPYRRVLDLRGKPQSFYGQIYYQATYNKEGRIKTVTRFGKDRKPKETYYFIWSRSGARSEYKVKFHEGGNVSRLDKDLYANELS